MKRIITRKLKEAIYSYEDFKAIKFKIDPLYSEKYRFGTVNMISGEDARNQAEAFGGLNSEILDECYYIFRVTLKGKLFPCRMTMHPKTAVNYKKGSTRFGSASIRKEALE